MQLINRRKQHMVYLSLTWLPADAMQESWHLFQEDKRALIAHLEVFCTIAHHLPALQDPGLHVSRADQQQERGQGV